MPLRNTLLFLILLVFTLFMFFACDSPSRVRSNMPVNVRFVINHGDTATRDTVLAVNINADNTDLMQVGFDSLLTDVDWEEFDTLKILHAPHREGLISVSARLATTGGDSTGVLRDDIELDFTARISNVDMISISDTLHAGEIVRFTLMTGEKGTAYLSITPAGLNYDFIHLGGGMFMRSIEIPSGLNLDDVIITGYFTDEVGNVAEPKKMGRRVTIRGPRLELSTVSVYSLHNVLGRDVWYSAGYCFVCDTHSVALVDVSIPEQPEYKRRIESGQWSSGFDGNSEVLFIPYNFGLAVMSIMEPEQADIIKTVHFNDAAHDVVITDDFAFVSCRTKGLKVFEIHHDYLPAPVGELGILGYGEFIELNEEIIYIAGWSWGSIIDVSTPQEPELLSSFELNYQPEDIVYYNDHLFIATRHNGILVFDVSNPYNPQQVSEHSDIHETCSFALAPPFLYVGGIGNLRILNATDPLNLDEIARVTGLGRVQGQFVHENYLYISQPSELVIIKLFTE
ncbi:MAG: hypothetical protein HQ568_09970 [Calditrichaeota bacterium]|nr:hypothetical protein [Calditrichota bacterium]